MITTRIMGIVNTTPDSFSDGGQFASADDAARHAMRLIRDGADMLDIGGESTRPGSEPVSAEEQIARTAPIIAAIRSAGATVPISIDTRLASVAAAALDAGADCVNDISALLHDPAMAALCAERGATVVLMHMRGQPATMQTQPHYDDVVSEVRDFLLERAEAAVAAGVSRDKIMLDPGIGFGKTADHNLTLLRDIDVLIDSGYGVLVGASRKAFLGAIIRETVPAKRDVATSAVTAHCVSRGVACVRVHDVAAARQVRDVTLALQRGKL